MRHLAWVLMSMVLAVVVATGITINPPVAKAAGGGEVRKCGGGKIFLHAKEKETFHRHNRIRKNNNLKTFCVHPKLQRAARAHSKDMIQRDYFSHDTKGGESFGQRLERFGYTPEGFSYYRVAENIALGSGYLGNPKHIMQEWMESPGHRRNILNGKLHQIGLGTHNGTYKNVNNVTMYTADFGTRRR